jgi:hypothetical protein
MHISFAVFADAANLSQEGKLNILGVFDAVRLKGDVDDVGKHSMTLRWLNPSGDELWVSGGELNVGAPADPSFEMDLPVIALIDLPLSEPGRYVMQLEVDGEFEGELPLLVTSGVPVVQQAGALYS